MSLLYAIYFIIVTFNIKFRIGSVLGDKIISPCFVQKCIVRYIQYTALSVYNQIKWVFSKCSLFSDPYWHLFAGAFFNIHTMMSQIEKLWGVSSAADISLICEEDLWLFILGYSNLRAVIPDKQLSELDTSFQEDQDEIIYCRNTGLM